MEVEALVHGSPGLGRRRRGSGDVGGVVGEIGGAVANRDEGAALHAEESEGFGRRRRVVGAVVQVVVLTKEAASSEPLHDAGVDVLDQGLELAGRGRRRLLEAKHRLPARIDGVNDVDAVEDHHVEMDVQVERGAGSVGRRDGAGLRHVLAAGEAGVLRPSSVALADGFPEDAREGAKHRGLGGRESAQLVGKRQDVLANGDRRQNAIDQVGGLARHSTSRAARAERPHFAGESDGEVMVARLALDKNDAS